MHLGTAYALVLLSAALHAGWNFVLKRDGGGDAFLALSKISEVVLLAPVFVAMIARTGGAGAGLAAAGGLVLGGASLTLLNYLALSRAYRVSDLSLVYPLSRGAALLFLPLLGYVTIGECIDVVGGVALLLILAGILVMHRTGAGGGVGDTLRAGAGYALLAGLATAAYTLWDKVAVGVLPVLVYFYAYTAIVGAALAALALRSHGRHGLAREWRRGRTGIVQVAILNVGAYLLILVALRSGSASYVVALRQVSIVFGVLLGWWFLGERITRRKWAGVALLAAGCGLVAFAR
jgi:drug/metabolite transporter (DMT)-like permease